MIYVGLDDTDIEDSPGTNQLARQIIAALLPDYVTQILTRHQLVKDPRVPFTSQNGCAALALEPRGAGDLPALTAKLCEMVRAFAPPGSDPGLCLATHVPEAVVDWGRRCEREVVTQHEARALASAEGIFLAGLGGTEGGVIGALAAVGLLALRDHGRVLYLGQANVDFYDITGPQDVEQLRRWGIDEIVNAASGESIRVGTVDVGKRLRPALRQGRVVLYAGPFEDPSTATANWSAVKSH